MRHTSLGYLASPPPPTIDHMAAYYERFGDTMELLHLDGAIGRQIRYVKSAAETAKKANQPEVEAALLLAEDALEDAREELRR